MMRRSEIAGGYGSYPDEKEDIIAMRSILVFHVLLPLQSYRLQLQK